MASVVTRTCLTVRVRRTLSLLFNGLMWKMEDLVPDDFTGTILWQTGHWTQYWVITLKSVTIKCSDCKSWYSNWIWKLFAQIVSAHNNFICRALQYGSLWVKALHLLHTQVLTQSDPHELYSDLASDADSQTIHISEVIYQFNF